MRVSLHSQHLDDKINLEKLDDSNSNKIGVCDVHRRDSGSHGVRSPISVALATLGCVGECRVGGPEGACRFPRETCTARRRSIHQAASGQTEVSRQDRPSINNIHSANVAINDSNRNGNGNGEGLHDFEVGVEQRPSPRVGLAASQKFGKCNPRGEAPLPKPGVYHVSRDEYKYYRAGAYVEGRTCPKFVGLCKGLRHDLREFNTEVEKGDMPSVLLVRGGLLARRRESRIQFR